MFSLMIVFIDVTTWLQLQMHQHKRARLTFLQVRMILFPDLSLQAFSILMQNRKKNSNPAIPVHSSVFHFCRTAFQISFLLLRN